MLTLLLTGTLIAAVAGLLAKFVADRIGGTSRITGFEFAIGLVVCTLVVIPAVTVVGVKQARASTTSYNEYWNGFEKTADVDKVNCTRDGSCRHTYQCDPYPVVQHYTERVQVGTRRVRHTSGTGKNKSSYYTTEPVYKNVQRTRTVIMYHSCPYAAAEYTYTVTSTLGSTYPMGANWVAANRPRFRLGTPVPASVPAGVPTQWAAAQKRIAAGQPGGVTEVHQYDNYILASQGTLLKKYSAAVDTYRKKNLLPKVASGVHSQYLADKVYFVGPVPGGRPAQWQEAAMRLNGALGSQRKGDLHLVIVTDPKVTNGDEFTSVVQAHWQSPAMGKDALSKNGLVVVLGSTDGGKTVGWARSFTGMPEGNAEITTKFRETLKGAPLTPAALLALPGDKAAPAASAPAATAATPTATAQSAAEVAQKAAAAAGAAKQAGVPAGVPLPMPTTAPAAGAAKATAPATKPGQAATGGLIAQQVFGQPGFKRVCMKGCGDGEVGYSYLIDQIEPTGKQKTAIVGTGFALALLVWGGLLAIGIPSPKEIRSGQFRADRNRRQTAKTVAKRRKGLADSPAFAALMDDRPVRVTPTRLPEALHPERTDRSASYTNSPMFDSLMNGDRPQRTGRFAQFDEEHRKGGRTRH